MNRKKREDFALICKLHVPELPFLRSFIDYYRELGVSKFYFIDTSPVGDERISEYLEKWYGNWGSFVTLENHQITEIANENKRISFNESDNIYNKLNAKIREEWLLVADVDEFFYFGKDVSLRDFVDKYPGDYYWFPWVKVVSDEWNVSTEKTIGFSENTVKYMVRTRHMAALKDHGFYRKGHLLPWKSIDKKKLRESRKLARKERVVGHPGVCIHYWSRGIRDVLIKTAANRVGAKATVGMTSNDSHEDVFNATRRLLQSIGSPEEIPKRLKMLAEYYLRNHSEHFDFPWQAEIDSDLLNQLLYEYIDTDTVDKLCDLYYRYKEKVINGEVSAAE